MSSVAYALVVWLLASVPLALGLGWLCSLNQLSVDDVFTPHREGSRRTTRSARG